MIDAKRAYEILSKEKPVSKVAGCLDFGDFYVFALVPFYEPNDETFIIGTVMDSVDKNSGQIGLYDITSDINAYENAKVVDVDTVFDRKV